MACLNFYWRPQRWLKEECPLLHSEARHTAVVVSVTLIAERMTMKQNLSRRFCILVNRIYLCCRKVQLIYSSARFTAHSFSVSICARLRNRSLTLVILHGAVMGQRRITVSEVTKVQGEIFFNVSVNTACKQIYFSLRKQNNVFTSSLWAVATLLDY